MAHSDADTPEEYLEELPAEQRAVLTELRELVLKHLPPGYEESMDYGMLSYSVPLERYPDTYNGHPLSYLALAAQKNHYALYAHGLYMDEERRKAFQEAWTATGKRLDMGKSCIRVRSLDDLPSELVGEMVASMPVDEFVARYEAVQGS